MDMVRVGFRSGFQYGHRLPEFDGKCRRVHGHNATVEIVAEADAKSLNQHGMVVDFGTLREIFNTHVRDVFDHRMLVEHRDQGLINALKKAGDEPYVLPRGVPATAEGISIHIRDLVEEVLKAREPRCRLVSVRVWETENCWAEARGLLNR
jgi:6-pyruvoyltetrahydropterin/6-carboxytetrahydropterin synthase